MGRVTENRRNSFPGKGLRLSTKDSKNKYIIKRRDNELLYAAWLRAGFYAWTGARLHRDSTTLFLTWKVSTIFAEDLINVNLIRCVEK